MFSLENLTVGKDVSDRYSSKVFCYGNKFPIEIELRPQFIPETNNTSIILANSKEG